MNTPAEPVAVSVTVLSQMLLYLTSLKVDIDAFLRSLGVDPLTVKSPDAYWDNKLTLRRMDDNNRADYPRYQRSWN